jgi:outer membrane protein assembly factor BamB
MNVCRTALIATLSLIALACSSAMAQSFEEQWPTWRGPTSTGVAPKGNPPITWSETENIKWKVKMPDDGESTPVIWNDKIFIQTAVPMTEQSADSFDKEKHPEKDRHQQPRAKKDTVAWRFSVLCLDRETGKTLWDTTVKEVVPHARHHATASHAPYSIVTDGQLLWAGFGSRGLYCLDMDGNIVWSADLPEMNMYSEYGEGSSPAIAGDNIIVVQDDMEDATIFAFYKHTGDLSWKKDRGSGHSAWSTPLTVNVDGKLQVITSGNKFMSSYDAETGDIIWTCSVPNTGTVPSPVAGHGNVYYMCGHPGSSLMALKLGGEGDLSDSESIVWKMLNTTSTPYVTSPLLYDDRIYFMKKYRGNISCFNAITGEPIFEEQALEGLRRCYASPVGAAGRIYVADRAGKIAVIKHSDTFEVLAVNSLDEGFDASPVIVGNELFLKGEHHLYCIAKP